MLTDFKSQIPKSKSQINSKLQYQMIETILISDLDLGIFNLQSLPTGRQVPSAFCNLKLARLTGWNLLNEFFLLRWGEILLDLPVLSGKRISLLDEKPFLSCASSLHQGKGETAL